MLCIVLCANKVFDFYFLSLFAFLCAAAVAEHFATLKGYAQNILYVGRSMHVQKPAFYFA